jgi:hypothetical protein
MRCELHQDILGTLQGTPLKTDSNKINTNQTIK